MLTSRIRSIHSLFLSPVFNFSTSKLKQKLLSAFNKKMNPKVSKTKTVKTRNEIVPLKMIITNTIKDQQQNRPDESQVNNFLRFNNWEMRTEGTRCQLIKELRDKVINLFFYSRHLKYANQKQNQQYQDEEAKTISQPVNVTVYIRKMQNLDSAMYIDLQCANSSFDITSISFTDDFHTHKTLTRDRRSQFDYKGPDVDRMNSDLKFFFSEYCFKHGINEQLSDFIVYLSQFQDEKQIFQWLKKFEKVV